MFDKRMETEAIPERVLSLCQRLSGGIMQEDELRKSIEPASMNGGKTTYFKKVSDAAIQLGLIGQNDDTKEYTLLVEKDVIESHESLKKYIVKNIEKLASGQFYKTTKLYVEKSEELFYIRKEIQSVSKLVEPLNSLYKEINPSQEELGLKNENMLAWRFWATYLGFGYLHTKGNDMVFLPNTAMYLKKCIECANLEVGKKYTISEFINALHPYIDICISTQDENNRVMNMALSNGFRTLNDLGIIELEYENDRQDEWNLTYMELHKFSSLVTDCIYKEKE